MAIPAFITITNKYGTIKCPFPKRGLELQTATFVDSSRNAKGIVVGQKIGRDQYKINNLEWPALSADQWSRILKKFNQTFYVTVKFPDMVNNAWKTIKMYPGDRKAEPYWLDPVTGLPTLYINCKVNIIDVGEDVIA